MSEAGFRAGGAGSARLVWQGLAGLSADALRSLVGPGAPFELTTDRARGFEQQTFVRRHRRLRDLLDSTRERLPDAPFLLAGNATWTYSEAVEDIDRIAALLAGRYGIRRGDRVAILSANSAEYALAMWAVISLGAIVSSLNGWWTAAEIEHGIRLTEPSLVLGDGPRLARLAEASLPVAPVVRRLEELLAEARAFDQKPVHEADVGEDDPAVILFTSGTTGLAKGAILSHRNLLHFALCNQLIGAVAAIRAGIAAPPRTAAIVQAPMFHVSGMIGVLTVGPSGTKLIFPPPGRWDPATHLRMTIEHQVPGWTGVPTQFWRMLRDPAMQDLDLSFLRTISSGGAPFPPELIRDLHARLPQVMLGNGYGMSESAGLGTRANGATVVEFPDSVGPANPTVEVEIRDEAGRVVGEDEVGEIHLRTATIFLGYWKNPEATAAAIDKEGWYRTGDFGRIRGGLLYMESRKRDLILRGGENIYPMEVEHRLVEHPDIVDAAVIGIDHPELGQEVKAYVVLREGARLAADEVRAFAAERLARFKVPAEVEFRASLPYTETGKVLKHQLEKESRTVP